MNKKTSMLAFSFISFCFLANVAVAWDGDDPKHHNKDYKDDTTGGAAGGMETDSQFILVKLIGDTVAYVPDWEVPGAGADVVCHDIDLLDLRINKIIGTATDCFSDIEMDGMGGASFTGTTFLRFPDGTIINQDTFVAQPALADITVRSGKVITAITGAASTGNTFIGGTGIYQDNVGNTRISGMVGGPEYTFTAGDELYFDCIFEIQVGLDNDSTASTASTASTDSTDSTDSYDSYDSNS